MKTSFRPALLLLAALAAAPADALFHPAPLRVPPGGPHPESWFEHARLQQHEELRRLSSCRSTQAQELAELLLNGDEDAYCELAVRNEENCNIVESLYSRADKEQRRILAPLRAYHQLRPNRPSFRDEEHFGEPRSHVVLYLRDSFRLKGQKAKLDSLHRILEQEQDLTRIEIAYIGGALAQWCGQTRDPLCEKRIVQSFILGFANGLPVAMDTEARLNISYSYTFLNDFLIAEAGVNNTRYFAQKTPAELMWRFLWQFPGQTIQLAEGLDIPAPGLLRMDSGGLADYVGSLGGGRKAAPTLPQADEACLTAPEHGLANLRRLLAEGKVEEAGHVVASMESDPAYDTTPACRMARSLLLAASEPELAARLRRDALLLALIRRDTEAQVLYAYVDDLLAHGTKDDLALAQRIALWCKALPDYTRLAQRYAQLGCWAEAAFCHEALLALAPHQATAPAEAELAQHRQQLGHCRQQTMEQQPLPPVAQATAPPSPFRAENREWKLKDGTSLQGGLRAIYPTLGEISLHLADGSTQNLPLDRLADKHDAYFDQWRSDNGIRDWTWRQGIGSYQGDKQGKLLTACADLDRPGEYHYTVVNENLSIARGQSWGLEAPQRELIAAHYREHGSARPCGDPIIATDLADARRLAAEKGLPIVFFFTSALQGSYSNEAIGRLETELALHPEEARRWREEMVILPIYLSTAKGYPAAYDDAELAQLRDYEREFTPGLTTEQSLTTAATKESSHARSAPAWVCPAHGLLSHDTLPPSLPKKNDTGRHARNSPQEL